MSDIMIIGIAGGTGSGKTTITRKLAERFGDDVTVIYHDNYYKPYREYSFEERVMLNYDHPDAFDTDLMEENLRSLKEGKTIESPEYDYAAYDRKETTIPIRAISTLRIAAMRDCVRQKNR